MTDLADAYDAIADILHNTLEALTSDLRPTLPDDLDAATAAVATMPRRHYADLRRPR